MPILFYRIVKTGFDDNDSVKNKIGKNISKNDSSGIGIPNLIKRLNLLYPEKHILEFNLSDSSYFAKLEINLNH